MSVSISDNSENSSMSNNTGSNKGNIHIKRHNIEEFHLMDQRSAYRSAYRIKLSDLLFGMTCTLIHTSPDIGISRNILCVMFNC